MPLNSYVSLFISCPDDQFIGESSVLKSPPVTDLGLICILKSSSMPLKRLGVLGFGAYMFRIIISSWLIVPLTRMKCSS